MRKAALALGLFFFFMVFKAYAFDDHDFQVWNTESEEFKLNKDWKLTLDQEFRWADNAHRFFYQHYEGGLVYSLNKYLSLGGGYRHVLEDKKDKFKVENEPFIFATLFWDILGFKFDDRNRMEYRHFDYQTDGWRYRNKFTVKLPWKFTKLQIQPYFSDEVFVTFEAINQFSQNRFFSGVGMALTKHIKTEIYYMLQSKKSTDAWIEANVLGTKLKFSF
ncbi:MAG: DUF2490 domain-containing protein [Candidatus Omnitrophica bacterium]|nr:DUF2490 domain-containing protein [Candidatus Omnitrophota bacterium]